MEASAAGTPHCAAATLAPRPDAAAATPVAAPAAASVAIPTAASAADPATPGHMAAQQRAAPGIQAADASAAAPHRADATVAAAAAPAPQHCQAPACSRRPQRTYICKGQGHTAARQERRCRRCKVQACRPGGNRQAGSCWCGEAATCVCGGHIWSEQPLCTADANPCCRCCISSIAACWSAQFQRRPCTATPRQARGAAGRSAGADDAQGVGRPQRAAAAGWSPGGARHPAATAAGRCLHTGLLLSRELSRTLPVAPLDACLLSSKQLPQERLAGSRHECVDDMTVQCRWVYQWRLGSARGQRGRHQGGAESGGSVHLLFHTATHNLPTLQTTCRNATLVCSARAHYVIQGPRAAGGAAQLPGQPAGALQHAHGAPEAHRRARRRPARLPGAECSVRQPCHTYST